MHIFQSFRRAEVCNSERPRSTITPVPRRDPGAGNAAAQETDDQLFPLGLRHVGGARRLDRSLARSGRRKGFGATGHSALSFRTAVMRTDIEQLRKRCKRFFLRRETRRRIFSAIPIGRERQTRTVIVGGIGGRANKKPNSNLELDPDFHDLRARDLEIGAGPLGVVVHEGEDRLAPAREPGRGPDGMIVSWLV